MCKESYQIVFRYIHQVSLGGSRSRDLLLLHHICYVKFFIPKGFILRSACLFFYEKIIISDRWIHFNFLQSTVFTVFILWDIEIFHHQSTIDMYITYLRYLSRVSYITFFISILHIIYIYIIYLLCYY